MRDSVFHTNDKRGPGSALHDTRGENADDATMPSVTIENEKMLGSKGFIGDKPLFDCREHRCLGIAPFAIQAFKLHGKFLRAVMVTGGEQLDHFRSDVHAAGGVNARRNAKSNIEASELL